jgi:hypothetical protein
MISVAYQSRNCSRFVKDTQSGQEAAERKLGKIPAHQIEEAPSTGS